MNRAFYRSLVVTAIIFSMSDGMLATELQTIKLNAPNKKRELPAMEAFSSRASAMEWSDQGLSLQDLSDLVWAANGINRPNEKKRTTSSAQNAQDVDLYLFMKDGVYLYDAENHELDPVISGDFRSQIMMARPPRPAGAPERGSTTPPPPPPSNLGKTRTSTTVKTNSRSYTVKPY